MKKIQSVLLAAALILGIGVAIPQSASADPYCYSFGMYGYCAEVPSYNTPPPPVIKPLPIWVCNTIYTAQVVVTVIPGGLIPTTISRVIMIPSLVCVWR